MPDSIINGFDFLLTCSEYSKLVKLIDCYVSFQFEYIQAMSDDVSRLAYDFCQSELETFKNIRSKLSNMKTLSED